MYQRVEIVGKTETVHVEVNPLAGYQNSFYLCPFITEEGGDRRELGSLFENFEGQRIKITVETID